MSAHHSSISFHCIICFETFDSCERYPIVFPCGHTYVCVECANRLDKCYECRTSLFYPQEVSSKPLQRACSTPDQRNFVNRPQRRTVMSYTSFPRRGGGTTTATQSHDQSLDNDNSVSTAEEKKIPPAMPPKKRIPLPKNLVLLSLIEVTEKATKVERDAAKHLCAITEASSMDEEREEHANVEVGTFLLSGACGTYMVACKEGLEIVSNKPGGGNSQKSSGSGRVKENSIVKEVRNMLHQHCDGSTNNSTFSKDFSPESSTFSKKRLSKTWPNKNKKKHSHVNYGDLVQVVAIEDGWAMLARRTGYVPAQDTSKLVKVDGPRDEVCRLEGVLYSLFSRWKSTEKERMEVERLKKELVKELKKAYLETEDVTLIQSSPETLEALREKLDFSPTTAQQSEQRVPSATAKENERAIANSSSDIMLEQCDTIHPDFRTGLSGHKALLSSKSQRRELNRPRADSAPKMSVHTALTIPKSASAPTSPDATAGCIMRCVH